MRVLSLGTPKTPPVEREHLANPMLLSRDYERGVDVVHGHIAALCRLPLIAAVRCANDLGTRLANADIMEPRPHHFALILLFTLAACADDGTTGDDAARDALAETPITAEASADVSPDIGGGTADIRDAQSETTDAPPADDTRFDATDIGVGTADVRDAQSETTDAPPADDTRFDATDADARGIEAGDDGASDSSADRADTVLDMTPDRLACHPSEVIGYNAPGCGANAPAPSCHGPEDACLTFICGCDGVTGGSGCGFATAPFAAWGFCPDSSGPDARSD